MKKTIFLKTLFLIFVAIATILVSKGCTKKDSPAYTASPSSSVPYSVFIENNAFGPNSITVPANATVTWTNKDGMPHTVTSTSDLFDGGYISSGSTYSYKFTSTGTFTYKCSNHSGMTGTVIVQ